MEFLEYERNDEGTGSVSIFKPPCECLECSQQHFNRRAQHWPGNRYFGFQTDIGAQVLLINHVTQIRKDQEYLRNAIVKHGNTIVGRWKKKSISKRGDCLTKALPTIAAKRWAILDYHYQVPASEKVEDVRKAYLLPYLSLDDLTMEPMRLLSLVHYRAKYDLDEWMLFDMMQTRTGWERGRLAVEYNHLCVVMYGTRYGELVKWDEGQAHRWDIVGFPRAQLIIEAQHLLFRFLRIMVEELLKDVEIESSSTKWLELSLSDFRQSQEHETWSAFSNQAYSAPPTFSVDRLREIAVTRLADAQDRLWLLQTDPSHMQNVITYHRTSLIGTTIRDGAGKKTLYGHIAHCLTDSPIKRVQDWYHIAEECKNLSEVQHRFRDNIYTGKPLPCKYNEAVGCLELVLLNVLATRTIELELLIPKLRGFEQSFGSPCLDDTGNYMAIRRAAKDTKDSYEEDPVLWCLYQMTMDHEYAHVLTEPAMLFGFFEDLVVNAARHSVNVDRIDECLLDELSEFGAVWELLTAVRCHRPVRRPIQKEEALHIAPPRTFWRQRAATDRRGLVEDVERDHEVSLVRKLDSMRMPSGKKDLAWLAGATEVRRVLKDFWAYTRRSQRRYLEKIHLPEEDIKTLLSLVSYDLAPEHLAALQEEQDAILARPRAIVQAKEANRTTQTYLDPSTSATAISELTIRTKTKAKRWSDRDGAAKNSNLTLDTDSHSQEVSPQTAESSKVTDAPPTLVVRPNNLKIFRDMYPTDNETPSGGTTDWRKFVGAMRDAGFAATGSNGSAVTFSNGSGRIIFHKPHPVAKIGSVMLVAWGKRLRKWFGWRRETFVSAEG